MFDEIKGLAEQKLRENEPRAFSDAAKAAIGEMPPGEVAKHAQAAIQTLNDRGETDLAKELVNLVQAARDNPVGLRNAVISFIEHHPEMLETFKI